VTLEKSIARGADLPEILSFRSEYPGPFIERFNRESVSAVKLLFAGIFPYFTGYLISASNSFPREFRYQKMEENKRKKTKTIIFLLIELTPFLIGVTVSFPSFEFNGCKLKGY
jgi:hypothetical protein